MMTLVIAAAVAAQPAPPAGPQGHMAPNQGEAMKDDCCKDCCNMDKMHSGHDMTQMPNQQEHSGHSGR